MSIPGPDTHVVELRVPGLVDTSGESLLDSVGSVDVAGDGIGRVVRPSDRLRRPAPGPVLHTLGKSVSRTLEGYLWTRMTSGNAARATWALLFPFSLVNVAHWMLPPVPEHKTAAAGIAAVCRGLLRIAALLLTMLLMSQLAVVSLDLVAAQCLAPGSSCLSYLPGWMRQTTGARTVIGVLPLLVIIGLLFRVSTLEWSGATTGDSPEPGNRTKPGDNTGPGDTVVDGGDTAMLRCVHTVAALVCVALFLLGGPIQAPENPADATVWAVALILLGFSVGATAIRARRLLGPVLRATLLTVAVGVVLTAAVLRTPLTANPVGTSDTVATVGIALLAISTVFAVLLVPAALLARPTWAHLPHRLRPWAGGWAAAPALALAVLLGTGFGAGLAIVTRRLLATPTLSLPPGYTPITSLWGTALGIAAVLAMFVVAVLLPLCRMRNREPDIVRLLQNRPQDIRQAARAWVRASALRKHLHRLVITGIMAITAGALVLVVLRVGSLTPPEWMESLSGVGVVTLGALAGTLLRAVSRAVTTPKRVRFVRTFVDLVCFWPRAAHPIIPPSYALKVVPELEERSRQHLGEPGHRVVLAGHQTGGLLAIMAAARLARKLPHNDRKRLGLLTAGIPLQWGYQRAFPAVFPQGSLAQLYGLLNGGWRGMCRGTDVFGGGVTTWRHQVTNGKLVGTGYQSDGGTAALEPAVPSETGVVTLGGDHWLPDPVPKPDNGRRWYAGIRRHTDYVGDHEWDRAVGIAAGLTPAAAGGQPTDHTSLFQA